MPMIGVGNKFKSGEDFVSELQKEPNVSLLALIGAVKLASPESNQELLFTVFDNATSWIPIPVAMIESVEVLGRVSVGGEICHFVRLYLAQPSNPHAMVLSRLLTQTSRKSQSTGAVEFASDGTLPLRASDGTLPLRVSDGTLPLGSDGTLPLLRPLASDGTLPLRLIATIVDLLRMGVGN